MASTYEWVSYGSRGDAVRQVQTILNSKGYSLDVDGVFGKLTRAAVLDYQKKNGLKLVDGVVGSETWGSLLASQTPAAPTASRQVLSGVSDETSERLAALEQGYTPSDESLAARAEYDSVAASEPEAYQSAYAAQLAQLYDELAARPGFSYDPEDDAAYQSAARQYARQGRAAMEDTLGQAAALTGGYGSTYAESTAQQAYQRYLSELSELLPELEQQAYSRYQAQGEEAERRYRLLAQQEQTDYDRWQDAYSGWQKSLESARSQADTADSRDRAMYQQLLRYYADKAADEQKAADGATMNTGGAYSAGASGAQTLSATAASSLERAAGNYLKAGNGAAARTLLAQYAARMNAAQRLRFNDMLQRYGAGTI